MPPPPSVMRSGLRVMIIVRPLCSYRLLDDRQRGDGVLPRMPRRLAPGPRCSRTKCSISRCQERSSRGYSQARRLGRSHLRQHPVVRQPLHAVASAQAVDLELAVAAEDLEREQVLPLRAACVQPGDLSAGPSRSSAKPLSSTGICQKYVPT